MPYRANYPASVREVLGEVRFRPQAIQAVRRLARSKPWRGSTEERRAKLLACLRELTAVYGLRPQRLVCRPGERDRYVPVLRTIYLDSRKMSVVTFLHEFGHARGKDERQTCRWSINLFRKCFPRSFARCRQVGHCLVRA